MLLTSSTRSSIANGCASLFGLAVDRLRSACDASGRARRFTVFERYDLADDESTRPTYGLLAGALAMSVTDVTNELAAARREFRRLVLDVLREQCATDEEFQNEDAARKHRAAPAGRAMP